MTLHWVPVPILKVILWELMIILACQSFWVIPVMAAMSISSSSVLHPGSCFLSLWMAHVGKMILPSTFVALSTCGRAFMLRLMLVFTVTTLALLPVGWQWWWLAAHWIRNLRSTSSVLSGTSVWWADSDFICAYVASSAWQVSKA